MIIDARGRAAPARSPRGCSSVPVDRRRDPAHREYKYHTIFFAVDNSAVEKPLSNSNSHILSLLVINPSFLSSFAFRSCPHDRETLYHCDDITQRL
jgi:hypothetical protein